MKAQFNFKGLKYTAEVLKDGIKLTNGVNTSFYGLPGTNYYKYMRLKDKKKTRLAILEAVFFGMDPGSPLKSHLYQYTGRI
jgi:hypothetical protein